MGLRRSAFVAALVLCSSGLSLSAPSALPAQQIDARLEVELREWAPREPRERSTKPEDWRYSLPGGVTTRQVTFYSDETRCYGKLFLPAGFGPSGGWPAVVLGHGFNAISVAIEKYGARRPGTTGRFTTSTWCRRRCLSSSSSRRTRSS